jgi:membrane protease YdiL (CAAX protease family)
MPMPLVAALIVERVAGRRTLLRSTFAEFRRTWWRIALVSTAAAAGIYALNLGLVFVLGNVLHVPGVGALVATQQALLANLQALAGQALPASTVAGMPPVAALYAIGILVGVTAGFSINGLFAFGEEYGWRGVLMDELRPLGATKANLLTGLMWGVWHAPIIMLGYNYGIYRLPGVFMMCVWLIPLSFLLWRAREFSGSVLAPAIIHGAFNGSAGFFLFFIAGGNRLLTAPIGILGALSCTVAAIAVWRLTSGKLFVPGTSGERHAPDSEASQLGTSVGSPTSA